MSETMKDYEAEINASFRKIGVGDIVTGTVIAVTEDEVTLDLRYFAPGIIKAEDYSDDPDCMLKEAVAVGDTIEATVIRTDDGEGNILLSKKEANNVLAWDVLNGYLEDGAGLILRRKDPQKCSRRYTIAAVSAIIVVAAIVINGVVSM